MPTAAGIEPEPISSRRAADVVGGVDDLPSHTTRAALLEPAEGGTKGATEPARLPLPAGEQPPAEHLPALSPAQPGDEFIGPALDFPPTWDVVQEQAPGSTVESIPPPDGRLAVEPIFDEFLSSQLSQGPTPQPGIWEQMIARLRRRRASGGGVGRDYLPFALVAIPAAQPASSVRFRFDAVYGLTLPDRAEIFWARPSNLTGGTGPAAPETSVKYQDLVFVSEIGGSKFSVTTELPIRMLDPTVNLNTSGFGDMNIITKTVLKDGESMMLTQYFRIKPPTGSFLKGLGNGNTILDPGVLLRHKLSDDAYFHARMSYAFPLGGFPSQQGQVLHYQAGVNGILYDSDTFAVIPSLEFSGMTFFDGQQAEFNGTTVEAIDVDTVGVFHIFPGVRFVAETGGDMGVFELGFGAGVDMGSEGWYENMTRMILRWSR